MPQPRTPEEQVLANIRAQAVGAGTVSDFELPEAFLKRVAGRILQLSFQNNFRLITPDETGEREDVEWVPPGPLPAAAPGRTVPLAAAMPAARGFWPLADTAFQVPIEPVGDQGVITLVAQRLARDGLLLTCVKAVRRLHDAGASASTIDLCAALANAGFPLDLLGHFQISADADPHESPANIVQWIVEHTRSANPAAWPKLLAQLSFHFRSTVPGAGAAPDSGQLRPGMLRLQLSRGGYWLGPGDGGSIDILQQLLEALPGVPVIAGIERAHVEAFAATTGTWPLEHQERIRLVISEVPLSQWAQDDAKSVIDAEHKPVLLVPRFASRGEQISQYLVGDTALPQAMTAEGVHPRHSPLHFQGGNLLMVEEPTGRRVLLIGEAEVYRNQSLGLTREQSIGALQTELGAEVCAILPAASIHIDYEVTCRVHAGKVIAFVADTAAALPLIIEAGLDRLVKTGHLPMEIATSIRSRLASGNTLEGVGMAWGALFRTAGAPGRFPLGLARVFKMSNVDSGVGNLRRFMAALDLTLAANPAHAAKVPDPNIAAYLRNRQQRQLDRVELQRSLEKLGWSLVPVPAFPQGELSINPLNGLHTPDAYLIPTYGGLYQTLDGAAVRVFAETLPGIKVIPVRCSESQRRDGALRCSAAFMPESN